ncbi:restriction endonuclease [Actinokineospora guangxiensis]|uniref:Restriction endonuclease n=1 Tax=Actinokineospora guangxiensis TaxID=1490288 RepID=A0ABW0EXI9_9PSEU
MSQFPGAQMSAPPQPRPKRRNAVLRLFDAPVHRDWAFWLVVGFGLLAGFSIPYSPPTTNTADIPVWLNTILAVIFFVTVFGILPAWIRLLVRRWRWRKWQQAEVARQTDNEHNSATASRTTAASQAPTSTNTVATESASPPTAPSEDEAGLGVTAADPTLVGIAQPASPPAPSPAIKVDWSRINADEFERLLARLLEESGSYVRITRPMNVNAADGGRDLQAYRRVHDGLSERLERTIVQAKHWPKRGVGGSEIAALVHAKLPLWEGEPVRGLIVATTGSFTQDAVRLVDKHNYEGSRPDIMLWSASELETLLRRWPAVAAEFNLINS